jgi:SLT domain-containing protein
METTFQWVISQLNCAVESEGLPNVINVIHWRYNAIQVDGDITWFAELLV